MLAIKTNRGSLVRLILKEMSKPNRAERNNNEQAGRKHHKELRLLTTHFELMKNEFKEIKADLDRLFPYGFGKSGASLSHARPEVSATRRSSTSRQASSSRERRDSANDTELNELNVEHLRKLLELFDQSKANPSF